MTYGIVSTRTKQFAGALSALILVLLVGNEVLRRQEDAAATATMRPYEASIGSRTELEKHPCARMWVWNKCLFAATHVHYAETMRDDRPPADFPAATYRDAVDRFPMDQDAMRIYVQTTQMKAFMEQIFPMLQGRRLPFVLVTGCSDKTVNGVNVAAIDTLLASSLLKAWFMQNPGIVHEKVVPVPIGVDFHTLVWKRFYWGTYRTSIDLQLQELDELHQLARNNPIAKRNRQVLVNFKLRGDDERSNAMAAMAANLEPETIREVKKLPRKGIWQEYIKVQFVLSPPGVGIDCHRTWEALVLGAIPIVLYVEEMESLYRQYPIVRVRSWDEITESNLQLWGNQYAAAIADIAANPEKLTSQYWIAQIYDAAA